MIGPHNPILSGWGKLGGVARIPNLRHFERRPLIWQTSFPETHRQNLTRKHQKKHQIL